ncbi:high mobility group B protein 3 [Pyrus ussuriensis x Pyrus communis]|uniref:High mobility group B protein 3 n=1 Tax=Pyrus ussuriensis x Pyrus communis TaxID=2448454 RepID=A0A5N5HI05_9ROSA|nr:high mobility group B protein 3 [Pyrus ussuriensis x Pyrus communis]
MSEMPSTYLALSFCCLLCTVNSRFYPRWARVLHRWLPDLNWFLALCFQEKLELEFSDLAEHGEITAGVPGKADAK